MMKTALTAVAGAAAGIALLLSCGDDTAVTADAQDAAGCDCPASEPPLAGRIVRVVGNPDTMEPDSGGVATAFCPSGATLLSGGCELQGDNAGVTINQARSSETGPSWSCSWWNPTNRTATGEATAICLVPPEDS